MLSEEIRIVDNARKELEKDEFDFITFYNN